MKRRTATGPESKRAIKFVTRGYDVAELVGLEYLNLKEVGTINRYVPDSSCLPKT